MTLHKEQKANIRKQFIEIRSKISNKQKLEAKNNLEKTLSSYIRGNKWIMSYFPIKSEIDISKFNQKLQKEKKLILPKIINNQIIPFIIEDLNENLALSSYNIYEPIQNKCLPIDPKQIDLIFVPGISFDQSRYRLGYGKGYYDKFLSITSEAKKIGVGYLEQLYFSYLPIEKHDVTVDMLELF